MRYPTIQRTKADELARRLSAGENPAISTAISWVGTGEDVDLDPLNEATKMMQERCGELMGADPDVSPEELEGLLVGDLHLALRDMPIEALDDPGFWRFVSLDKMWWFISMRESQPISRGNHLTYIDGLKPSECVPLRMFLRAQAVQDGDDYSLAASMKRAADFWRSHIIRVRTGAAPPLARSFTRLQKDVRMPTAELRPFARRVNRLWTNVVMERLDDSEADEVMRSLYELRAELDESGSSAFEENQ